MEGLDTVKALCASASTDVTRYHLNGVHYDGEYFVSTDGHRLIACKADQYPIAMHIPPSQLKPGDILETKAFKSGGVNRIDGKYPNYKQLLPDPAKALYAFRLTLPLWLKDVKVKRKNIQSLGINENGEMTNGPALIHVNPFYLAPFAGQFVDIYITDSCSPIYIEPADGKEKPWKAVVMPMRMSKDLKVATVLRKPVAVAL